ncbi:hypothetical protein SPFM20_00140 [Salmonella phage SPFM20]|nr:hypothetical protein SPFM20_00140 [Salmonella phage SPFM20]
MINYAKPSNELLKLPVTCTTIVGTLYLQFNGVGLNDPVAMPTNAKYKYALGTAWVATTSASYGLAGAEVITGILSGQPLTDMVNLLKDITEVYSYPYNFTKYRDELLAYVPGLKYPNGQMGSETVTAVIAAFKVVKGDESLVSAVTTNVLTEGTVRVVAHPESIGWVGQASFVLEEADLQDADIEWNGDKTIGPSNETLYAAIPGLNQRYDVFYNRMKVEDLLVLIGDTLDTQIKITADGVTGSTWSGKKIIWSSPKDIRGTEKETLTNRKDVLLAAVNAQNSLAVKMTDTSVCCTTTTRN